VRYEVHYSDKKIHINTINSNGNLPCIQLVGWQGSIVGKKQKKREMHDTQHFLFKKKGEMHLFFKQIILSRLLQVFLLLLLIS
jgi:hypothetical protein